MRGAVEKLRGCGVGNGPLSLGRSFSSCDAGFEFETYPQRCGFQKVTNFGALSSISEKRGSNHPSCLIAVFCRVRCEGKLYKL